MTGTFKQGGKELDASLYQVTGHYVPSRVTCPNGHQMAHELSSRGIKPPEILFKCLSEGCEYRGIIYRPLTPIITLEAIQDEASE